MPWLRQNEGTRSQYGFDLMGQMFTNSRDEISF